MPLQLSDLQLEPVVKLLELLDDCQKKVFLGQFLSLYLALL